MITPDNSSGRSSPASDTSIANPYAPPATTDKVLPASTGTAWPGPQQRSPASILIVLAVALAYGIFLLALWTSTAQDQQAAIVLMLNTPVLGTWTILVIYGSPWDRFGALIACGTQCLITLIMLGAGIGTPGPVCTINGIIFGILAAAGVLCRLIRPQLPPSHV